VKDQLLLEVFLLHTQIDVLLTQLATCSFNAFTLWAKSSVSFIVHCRHFWSFLLFSTSLVKHIFCAFTSGGGNSKCKLAILYNFRQFMTSLMRFTKRLSLMALILHFLEIVVEISKSYEILSFDYLAHFF